jgi:spermidine/putrescine ABC transporter ATP-binding subunit
MTQIRLEEVTKTYGAVKAVDSVSLEIREGELFTILGPSGCGKTTTLRIIAGFEVPDEGRVYFDDEDVTFLKPYLRNTAMVFQNYALWPHMTVFENVAYGLKIRKKHLKLSDDEIERRVREVLRLVKLEGMEDRYPLQLSGGQQQRVALARALVVQPKVLLLDEPLSNLDAKLRIEMREEIKRIQKSLGITTVYVTHDQLEAMSISDRIAVMDKGRVLQYGSPREVYFKPTNLFTAEFLGRSNIFRGRVVEKKDDYVVVRLEDLELELKAVPVDSGVSGEVAVVVRPESFDVEASGAQENVFKGKVDFAMFLGDKTEVRLKVGRGSLIAYLPNNIYPEIGSELALRVSWRNVIALPYK